MNKVQIYNKPNINLALLAESIKKTMGKGDKIPVTIGSTEPFDEEKVILTQEGSLATLENTFYQEKPDTINFIVKRSGYATLLEFIKINYFYLEKKQEFKKRTRKYYN